MSSMNRYDFLILRGTVLVQCACQGYNLSFVSGQKVRLATPACLNKQKITIDLRLFIVAET